MVQSILNPNEIDIFYPKNIFVDENILEFVIFSKGKVIVIINELDEVISTQVNKVSSIESIQYEKAQNTNESDLLRLSLSDNSEILFDSNTDSNEHWKHEYKYIINEIIKYLINDGPNQQDVDC